jgi:hypothetical protein
MSQGMRRGLAVMVLMALGSVSSARTAAAPPPNDDFPGASLSSSPVSAGGTNVQATLQTGEPDPAGSSGTASVWWTWTPSVSGRYGVNTAGSDYDTTLGVYLGTAVDSLALVAENDDSAGLTSRVSFDAVGGTPYRILVNGFLGDTGNISLNIVGPVSATVVWATPPPSTIAAGTSFDVSWTTSGATTETDLLIDTVDPPDLTSAGFPQSGGAGTFTEPLTAPTFGSTWYFQAHAVIGGVDFFSPVIQVTVPPPPPPANDAFPGIALSGSVVSTSGTNIGATAEAGEPDPAGVSGTQSVWWSWMCPATGTATISLMGSNYDTTLGVYIGNTVSGLTLVAENDESPTDSTSVATFPAFSGVTYQIQVNGYFGSAGAISLDINGPTVPAPRGGGGGGRGGCGLTGIGAILPLLFLGLFRRGARRVHGR